MQIDPDQFYPEKVDCPVLAVLGAQQTRAIHRHKGKGGPYIKLGSRVIYMGRDILDHLQAKRVEPTAA